MMPVRLKHAVPLSRVKHSTTEPLRSPKIDLGSSNALLKIFYQTLGKAFVKFLNCIEIWTEIISLG